MGKMFSTKDRPVHLGSFPLEKLRRLDQAAGLEGLKPAAPLTFTRPDDPHSIVNAMAEYMGMLDTVRVGNMNPQLAKCPDDPAERSRHLKAFAYFTNASMAGTCALESADTLSKPYRNPEISQLAHRLRTEQTKTLSAGMDVIMADLKASMDVEVTGVDEHSHALVIAFAHPRDPRADEPGSEWIRDAQAQRSALRANECASVLANYLRLLGHQARSHSVTSSEVCLNRLAVKAGIAIAKDGEAHSPLCPQGMGLAVVTTDFALEADHPLDPAQSFPVQAPGFEHRNFADSEHPFETLRRVDEPTTFIDEPRVARVPKRADMFARAQFGDLGPNIQKAATNGKFVRQAPTSWAQRRVMSALAVIQNGAPASEQQAGYDDPERNAAMVKAAAYWLGADAVGISRCPEWSYYSHDARGEEIVPYHDQAISVVVDQGFDTMEGASGDDWISCAQSMRAYLRYALIGGVLARHMRSLGFSARSHTATDGEILQPPLLLLAGLGEVSRIGEVILNPFLGPRLKSGVITTSMPLAHDRPIDFGLQAFCESCNKCARECPSGAITAGPKLMFNGYEIWKSDSQRCTNYRLTVPGGAMCGRCMKTCPWNLEGLMVEGPFRWMAMNVPQAAPWLARMDDWVGHGRINPVKKWWWDLEEQDDGSYSTDVASVNQREIQTDLDLKYEDQTLAVYPAPLAPHPYPSPFIMDRERAIEAYQAMVTAEAYKLHLAEGTIDEVAHVYSLDPEAPVMQVLVSKAEEMARGLMLYELTDPAGQPLPEWAAGAHIDVVVSPEFLRQYSLAGDPADRSKYVLGVLREDEGRGGSKLMHRIFSEGRRVFISKPINHFPIMDNPGGKSWLMGGGIGVTPMIAMAHELHAQGRDFALHYSVRKRETAGFWELLADVPWADGVQVHVSAEGSRADLGALLGNHSAGDHVYCCGPDAYMQSVMDAAEAGGFPEDARHLEYFAVPEMPEYENHPFELELKDGRVLPVAEDRSAAAVLQDAGFKIDIKCSDGICGVCKCGVLDGEVEHRDFVLSGKQRETSFISCQSRAAEPGGRIKIDL
ncbi:MAG: NAD-binding oxidoreductase [Geminicoccus sp.]|nr:NAD-binding oxidoreductase [Geminicoccus sp.]